MLKCALVAVHIIAANAERCIHLQNRTYPHQANEHEQLNTQRAALTDANFNELNMLQRNAETDEKPI